MIERLDPTRSTFRVNEPAVSAESLVHTMRLENERLGATPSSGFGWWIECGEAPESLDPMGLYRQKLR